jgi:hypothetical protein
MIVLWNEWSNIDHHSDWLGILLRSSTTKGSLSALRSRMNWLMLTSVDFLDCSLGALIS